MYPQVVQLDVRRSQIERELQLVRERRTSGAAAGTPGTASSRLRTFLRGAGRPRRAAESHS